MILSLKTILIYILNRDYPSQKKIPFTQYLFLKRVMGSNPLPLILGRDGKAEYRFHLYIRLTLPCRYILHEHQPANAVQAVIFCIGIAPAYGFPVRICQIALNNAVSDIFRSQFHSREIFAHPMVVTAPADTVHFAFALLQKNVHNRVRE